MEGTRVIQKRGLMMAREIPYKRDRCSSSRGSHDHRHACLIQRGNWFCFVFFFKVEVVKR